jgi:hypothetical protein
MDARLIDQLAEVIEENRRLTEALVDFREYGLRCDLNPTMPSGSWEYGAWSDYLRRADANVRDRASRALKGDA